MDTASMETTSDVAVTTKTTDGQLTASTIAEAELPTPILVTVPGSLCANGPEVYEVHLLTVDQLWEVYTKCDALAKVNRVKIINATTAFASSIRPLWSPLCKNISLPSMPSTSSEG